MIEELGHIMPMLRTRAERDGYTVVFYMVFPDQNQVILRAEAENARIRYLYDYETAQISIESVDKWNPNSLIELTIKSEE